MSSISNQIKISAFYVAVFNRAPDVSGLNYWLDQISGASADTVFDRLATGFTAHPAFTETYSSLNDVEFVNAIYTNVLGAEGDAKGVIYWTNKIVQDGWTRAEVISQFVQDSLEIDLSTGAAAWGLTDEEYAVAVSRQDYITNKANVALDFTLVLGSDSNLDADTDTTTLDGLYSDNAFLASVAVLAAVTDDPQSAEDAISMIHDAADSNDAITYILENAPDSTYITGERYTLSIDNEEIVGTRHNDLIVGSNVPLTFNVVDSIDGGDGVDTLQLGLQAGNTIVGGYVSNIERLTINAVQGDNDYSDDVVLDMSHFDSSLEEINITDTAVGVQLLDQQSIANVNIRDLTGYYNNVTLDYDAQVVMGDADVLNISVDEVAGFSGSYISVDTDIEQINITVLDGVSEESAFYLNSGAGEVTIDGGIVGQVVEISLDAAGGSTLDSTAFEGDLNLISNDLATIRTGAGSDAITTSGWINNTWASYNLGEGNNTLTSDDGIAGTITVGSGNDTVYLYGGIGGSATITLGDGTNQLTAGDADNQNVAGTITGGSGADTVTLSGDLIDSGRIVLAAGNNVLILDGASGTSTITAGDGDNTVTLSENMTGSASITVGNGNNTVAIDDIQNNAALVFGNGNNTLSADQIATNNGSTVNVTFGTGVNELNANEIGYAGAATIVYGNGDGNSLNVRDNIFNSSVTFGDGNTNIFTADQVISTTVRFGNGDNNTMTVNSINDAPDTVAFGNGDGNTLTVDGDIFASTVTFGSGADNTLTVNDDVWSSTVTFGNGGAEMFVRDDIRDATKITFGSGADTLQIGDGLYGFAYVSGIDVLTEINLGGGDDAVTITGRNGGDTNVLVASGAKIDGGAGTNDVLTIEAVDYVDNVVDSNQAQVVTLTFSGSYQNGQVVSVTIDGQLISYTIVNLTQGPDEETLAQVANGLNAAIEAANAALTSTVNGGVITLTGSINQNYVTVVAAGSTVDVVQIAETGISGFETLNLVALNPIVADGDDYDETADITANFEFITGVNTVNLINESAHIVTNHDPLLNGAYDEVEDGDAADFTLENLNGNEAITVSSDEVTASLNLYVNRITVGANDDDHEVGDKLTFSYEFDDGDTEEYVFVVSSNDLNGATALADATNIATRLFNEIKNIPALSGVTFERDANQITLTATDDLALWTEISHTRAVDPLEVEGTTLVGTEIAVGTYGTPETYNIDDIDHIVGDLITVKVGANQYTLTVTEADLFGANGYEDAVLIATRLASILEDGGETVALDGNVINIDTTDVVTLTDLRPQDDEDIGSTSSEVLNFSNNGDDADADVLLNLNLATNTNNDVLDVTLNGTGNFDFEISGDNQYETLDLSITDGFSHYIDLGYEISNVVTVTGAGAGQLIELDYLSATTVTANNAADYNIWQEVGVNDVVTVRTGAGDDFLNTTAEALFNNGSTVNLGLGNNTLGIYWIDPIVGNLPWNEYITGEMLAEVSTINFTGNLNTLEIYEDVELVANSSTTLAMPAGGNGEVSTLNLDSIIVNDHADDASLTITGTTNELTLELNGQGEDGGSLGQFYGVDGEDYVDSYNWSQINLNAVGVKDLSIISGEDSVNVELLGNTLENLTIESSEHIALRVDGTTGDVDGIQNQLTKLETISLSASTDVYLDIVDSHTDISISTLIRGSQGEFILDVAYSDIGDIYTEISSGDGEDSIINISGTDESSVSVGNITVKPNAPNANEDGNNNALNVEDNDGSTVTLGNVTLSANDSTDFDIFDNDSFVDQVTGEVLHEVSVTVGDVTMDGFDTGMFINDNNQAAIDIGAVTLNALTFPDLVQGEDNNVFDEYDANNADLSINDNDGSEITIASVDLTAKNGYTSLNINSNDTNTYVDDGAEDGPDDSYMTDSAVIIDIGDVTLTTRGTRDGGFGEDATVQIDNNEDNSDAVDASITLGDVSVSAYGYAGLDIHDNYDATINTGNLSAIAGYFAELVIDDEEYSTISIAAGGTVNLVSGEDLELQVTDSWDVKTTIGAVTGTAGEDIYVNVNSNNGEDVNSFVKIASIDLVAGDDAYVDINDNDAYATAQLIEIGNVTINVDDDIFAHIDNNDDTEIVLGDVTFNADGEDYLSIDDNDDASVTLGDLTMATGYVATANILSNDNTYIDIGDVSLTATDSDSSANVFIYNNENSVVFVNSIETDSEDYSRVTIDSNYNYSGPGEDTRIDIDEGVDISVVSATSNDADAGFEINNNDMINGYSDDLVTVDIAGDISVAATNSSAGDAYADFDIDDNYFTTINLGTATDSITVEATVTSVGVNDAYAEAGFNITDNVTLITMTDVAVHAHATTTGTDAEAYAIYSVRNNDLVNTYAQGGGVNQGDVEVTAIASAISGEQNASAYFEIFDNDGYDDSSDDVVFNMEVDKVTVTTEGELGGAYVNVGATTSDQSVDWGYAFDVNDESDNNWNADIVLGDVTVNAGNYAEVILSNGEDSSLEVGDIDVTSGETAGAATGDINLYLGDVIGAENVTLDASAADNSHVDVNIWDSENVDTVTISGSYTNVLIYGEQDSLNTLDLSGVDGFAYVETWNADLREGNAAVTINDTLTIKIGDSDVQYNAMYGEDSGSADGRDDWGSIVIEDGTNADDQYGNAGWYNLAVTTNADNQTQVISGFDNWGANIDNPGTTFYSALQFNHNDVSYRIQVSNFHVDNDNSGDAQDSISYDNDMTFGKLVSGSWITVSEADVAYDLGVKDIAYSASGGDGVFTLTGYDDGARFDVVTDVYQVKDETTDSGINAGITSSPRNLVVNNSAGTFDGTSNDVSEVFQFVGDTIGDIVIGGFNPEGFAGAYGNWTDRLDFSQFDGVNSVNDLTFSINHNDDGNDGWYDDVVIDFIDTDLGSIRLVGVGRFDTNAEDVINNVQSSILF